MAAGAVTPAGVRDGNPDALAGLCERRGPAVFAYCERVVGDGHAMSAAAEAFRRFRAAVVAAPDLRSLDPEALLISAARHAAAEHVPRPPTTPDALRAAVRRPATGWCGDIPSLLAARADRVISTIDLARLEQHVAGCPACRAPEARFEAAERAYRQPPSDRIPIPVTAAIMSALATAAPIDTDAAVTAAPDNGGLAHAVAPQVPLPPVAVRAESPAPPPEPVRAAPPKPVPVEPAPPEPVRVEPPPPPAPPPEPVQVAPPEPPATELHVLPNASEPPATELHAIASEPEPEPAGAIAVPPAAAGRSADFQLPAFVDLGAGSSDDTSAPRRVVSDRRRRVAMPAFRSLSLPSLPSMPALPSMPSLPWMPSLSSRRPRQTHAPGTGQPAGHAPQQRRVRRTRGAAVRTTARPAIKPTTLLPIVLVVIAIVIALAVAGVFDSGTASPSNSGSAPSVPAGSGRRPQVVVVPGADMSAAAVEAAKARARAKARRAARRSLGPTAAAPPPPAPPAQSSPSQQNTRQPSAPTRKPSTGAPAVNGGAGATGANPAPSPGTSTVPNLAPAPPPP